jgi:N-methylhydantoinase B/oxoprolinase/acetone carboxylase alpha subunit
MSIEDRKNRNVGRPPLEDKEQIRDKKVMMSFTQSEYDELKRMQKLLNKSTLTATINYFIDRGREAVREDFNRER